MSQAPAVVLLFDGTCGFCTWCARWLRRRDRSGRVLLIPSQSPGAEDRFGLSRPELDRAAWAIEAGGARHRGAAAINRALFELPGAWPRIAGLYGVPLIHQLEDGVYVLVARTRRWLSHLTHTRPECDEPGVDCA